MIDRSMQDYDSSQFQLKFPLVQGIVERCGLTAHNDLFLLRRDLYKMDVPALKLRLSLLMPSQN